MIKPGDVIKHEKFMDVFSGLWGFSEGRWLQRCRMLDEHGHTKSWMIDNGTFFIKTEDIPKWSVCIDEGSKPCIRYCTWVSLAS